MTVEYVNIFHNFYIALALYIVLHQDYIVRNRIFFLKWFSITSRLGMVMLLVIRGRTNSQIFVRYTDIRRIVLFIRIFVQACDVIKMTARCDQLSV